MIRTRPVPEIGMSAGKPGGTSWSLFLVLVIGGAVVHAEAPQPQRLRGIIDRDAVWSGHILITDNLSILGATVTIRPGTLIEFAHAVPGSHPTLTVGSAEDERGELIPRATRGEPVTIRSRPGTNTGRVLIYVRNRFAVSAPPTPDDQGEPRPRRLPADVDWRFVRFENLGTPSQNGRGAGTHEPAVTFILIGSSHTVRIDSCEFTNSTRLRVRADDDARITVENNRFRDSRDRVALELSGTRIKKRLGRLTAVNNRASAGFVLERTPARIERNILIGRDAFIAIRQHTPSAGTIAGNYVHNTTDRDDGRYCLDTDDPETRIENNIFRGGTTCVLNGSRWMTGNVFIAAPNLTSKIVKQSRTHQLVGALPAGAVFRRNLLIGPAHSMLVPQPLRTRSGPTTSNGPTLVEHNIFDGLDRANRAIQVNPIGRLPVQLSVANNLFLRVASLLHDASRGSATVIYADHNACAPLSARTFDRVKVGGLRPGEPGWAAADIRRDAVAALRLAGEPFGRAAGLDAEIESGRRTVEQLRRELFDRYRPRAGSPLVGAGRETDGRRPSIGASEPAAQ